MDAANPFAQMPATPEAIIARVCRELAADCGDHRCPPCAELDRLAAAAGRELWDGKVRVFVPILTLRQAREMLLMGDWTIAAPVPALALGQNPVMTDSADPPSRAGRDALRVDGDFLIVTRANVMNPGDDRHA